MSSEKEVLITHLFKAPVDLVYRAFTDQKYLERWFAPNGCSVFYVKLDIKVGGAFHSCIVDPKHGNCWCIGVYKKLIRNKRIVYEISNSDENGRPVKPSDIGMDAEWPMTTLVSITFETKGEMTEVVLHQTVAEKIAKKTGAYPSWIQMLERLNEILK